MHSFSMYLFQRPPDDEHLLLETCRGVEINTLRKSASSWTLTRKTASFTVNISSALVRVPQSTVKFDVQGTTRVMFFSTQVLYISSVWNHEKRFLIKVSENRHLT